MQINQSLKNLLDNNRLAHAVILEGVAARETADYIAMYAVCTQQKKPCMQCRACVNAANKNHADIKYYEPASAVNPYPVDTIREIRMDAYILPNEADRKVYVLNGVDNMSAAAQNAMLKIFEEPPEYVLFILTCMQKDSLLDTVISRAMVFGAAAQNDNISSENSEAQEYAEKIAKALTLGEELTMLKLTSALSKDKPLLMDTLEQLNITFRDVYREKNLLDSGNPTAAQLSGELTVENAIMLVSAVQEIRSAVMRNANPTLNMTRFCSLLREAAGK